MDCTELIFSPTGGTRRVTELLTQALGGASTVVDLTDSRLDFAGVTVSPHTLSLIAVPSYGGRVPAPAVDRLAALNGNGSPAVLVCVYGNRAYEDTLAELQDTAQESGFRVVAAVAAVAEHSIVREVAAGRPDADDAAQLQEFARRIAGKLAAGDDTTPEIPGNRPYKKRGGGMVPAPTRACVRCGLCAANCPVQAIDTADPARVDGKVCISCMRCVAVCPHQARQVNPLMQAGVEAMLKKVCADRKTCELYL